MQVRNQRRTLQYPRRAVLRQMLGQGSGPQEKDDGTAGDGTVGKYGPPFRIANKRDKSNDNKIKQLNTDIVMIRKWIKRLLAPIMREVLKEEQQYFIEMLDQQVAEALRRALPHDV